MGEGQGEGDPPVRACPTPLIVPTINVEYHSPQ